MTTDYLIFYIIMKNGILQSIGNVTIDVKYELNNDDVNLIRSKIKDYNKCDDDSNIIIANIMKLS